MPEASKVPEGFRRDPAISYSDATPKVPRIVVCTTHSEQVESGQARPGAVIFADTGEPVTQPVQIVGYVRYWTLYPPYTPGGDNKPLWVKPDTAETRALPECQWYDDAKPEAAECCRFALYSQEGGLRVLTCQRSAMRAAKDVLALLDSSGVVLHGPVWKLMGVKCGKTHIPEFRQAGFASSPELPVSQDDIDALLAL